MRYKLVLLLALGLISFCKEEKPIGKGFVLQSPIQVFSKPDHKSEAIAALPVLSEVQILKIAVPDKKTEKLYWFKVRGGQATGYVSYDEELIKSNFVAVKPEVTGRKALTVADLRLREKPTQKSASVGLLKKGTVLDIVAEGSLRISIDGRADTWLEVTSPDQKHGYVFGGYTRKGNASDFDTPAKIAEVLTESEKGWLIITAEKPRLEDAEREFAGCRENPDALPKKGDIVTIRGKRTQAGKTYYRIAETAGDFGGCIWGYAKWIPADDIEYIANLYEYTKKLNTAVEPSLLDFINANLDGVLDARSTTARKVNLRNEPGVEYYEVTARVGVAQPDGPMQRENLIMYASKKDGQYKLIGKYFNANLQDIDGDGNMELTTDVSVRESVPLHVYSYDPAKGFVKIFEFDAAYGASTTIDQPYLVVEMGYDLQFDESIKILNPKYKQQRIHTFKLANGKFTEVALPPKYQKREAELRGPEKPM